MSALIRMPEVLAGAREGAVQTWLVAEGDEVAIGAPLAEIETDKAVVEFASEVAGTVARLLAAEGDNIDVGTPIVAVLAAGEGDAQLAELLAEAGLDRPALASPAPSITEPSPIELPVAAPVAVEAVAATAEPPAPAEIRIPEEAPAQVEAPAREGRLFATPLVRRLARERGIDLTLIVGSGPDGRVVRRDLDRLPAAPVAGSVTVPESAPQTESAPAAVVAQTAPVVAPADPDAFVDTPAGSMRRTIARRLTESKTTVPHFYMTRHLEIDALLALRAEVNRDREQRVSVNDLVVKAVALAHRAVPDANAIWRDGSIRRFRDVDVAVAVALDGGLVTPVIRGADALSVAGIAERTRAAAERARTGALLPGELEGGTIAVSNLGMYGIDEFAAIINPPQSGILAVGAGTQRAVVHDGELAVATVMSVTLSGDHRVLDGAVAAEWMAELARLIENPMNILAG